MSKSDFNERKQTRINKLETAAENARNRSESAFKNADQISSHIPFGQPILVGHHSEKRHRRDVDKITNSMRKGIEESKKAEYFEQRARAAENNKAIFSDDPEATEKLAERIEKLEKRQQLMKDANKLLKKNDIEGLLNLGFTANQIERFKEKDCFGNIGFAPFQITNNGANIRRLKLRLQEELKKAEMETTEETFPSGVRIVQNTEENRCQIFFPVPRVSKEIYSLLKSRGFRLTREGIWQRHISNGATWAAKEVEKKFAETV